MIIFVYGSLKKNKRLHYFLKNSKFLGVAKTKYKYPLILSKSKWYPYLINKKNCGYNVIGEIYKINYNTLKKLDILEEVPFYYKRKKIIVKKDKKTLIVYTYFFSKNKKFLKKDLLAKF